eukprot:TRINITY_DN1502_c0_g1_i1.p2 TRINITY_DN1502_c0_g1~~TRINITY_DN1502_c0_g1_i1.p2  ORF type:complete len:205 (-),score=21.76 TRINITY_DN1502_c0_g1_i1:446-1060(-)
MTQKKITCRRISYRLITTVFTAGLFVFLCWVTNIGEEEFMFPFYLLGVFIIVGLILLIHWVSLFSSTEKQTNVAVVRSVQPVEQHVVVQQEMMQYEPTETVVVHEPVVQHYTTVQNNVTNVYAGAGGEYAGVTPHVELYHYSWTPYQTAEFISQLGLAQYAEIFIAERVTGRDLHDLDHDTLKEFGIQVFGDRNLILNAIPHLT